MSRFKIKLMHRHHGYALMVIVVALVTDFFCGLGFAVAQSIPLWHGLYCALANAVTLGGDVSPTTAWGYGTNAIECFTVVPLFAAALSLFTSGLTSIHHQESEQHIKQHIDALLRH